MAAIFAEDISMCIFMTENFCILTLRVHLKISHIYSGNGLAPNRRQSITWANVDTVQWREYDALGEDELKQPYICLSKN